MCVIDRKMNELNRKRNLKVQRYEEKNNIISLFERVIHHSGDNNDNNTENE